MQASEPARERQRRSTGQQIYQYVASCTYRYSLLRSVAHMSIKNVIVPMQDLLPLALLAAPLQPKTVRMAQRPSSRPRATCPRSRRPPQAARCRNPRQPSRAHSSCPLPPLLQPAPSPRPCSKVAPPPKATLPPSKRPRHTLPSLVRASHHHSCIVLIPHVTLHVLIYRLF